MSANDGMDVDWEPERLMERMGERASLSGKGANEEEVSGEYLVPGEVVTEETGFMRGHGTRVSPSGGLVSSVAGTVEAINRLVCVRTAGGSRYSGEIGDVVVGRITEVQVQQKRWKVDTNGRLHSILLMSSINLPGGELRRKTEEDEMRMRSYFVEGDLISAEVQSVFADGSLSLHTRSLKYGKLGQGILLLVPPALIQRRKTHFHHLPPGAHLILGNNGYVWITSPVGHESGGFVVDRDRVPAAQRQVLSRLANCVSALVQHHVPLQDTSITYAYEESLQYPASFLMRHSVSRRLAHRTRLRLTQQ